MTVAGELYPLRRLEHPTSEKGGGSRRSTWNTPNTMDSLAPKSQKALDHEHETARPGRTNPNNLRDQVAVEEGMRMWPTPVVQQFKSNIGGAAGRVGKERLSLHGMATTGRWRTPDSYPRGGATTPEKRREGGHSINLRDQVGGQLNPDWVEWLMCVPIGWTSLDPLPQERYDEWARDDGTWWFEEPDIPRIIEQYKARGKRASALGNGIVPTCIAEFLRRLGT
jgi:hypothetical protein